MKHPSFKSLIRHYINPMKLKGWLRKKGFGRRTAEKIAMFYEGVYLVIF